MSRKNGWRQEKAVGKHKRARIRAKKVMYSYSYGIHIIYLILDSIKMILSWKYENFLSDFLQQKNLFLNVSEKLSNNLLIYSTYILYIHHIYIINFP